MVKIAAKNYEVVKMRTNNGINKRKMLKDKLQGRYDLMINKGLPFNKKIQKFAADPHAFHLHKRRDFCERLDSSYEV